MAVLNIEGNFISITFGTDTKYFPAGMLDITTKDDNVLIHGSSQGQNNRPRLLDELYSNISGDNIFGTSASEVAYSIVQMVNTVASSMSFADSASVDAFGRLRVGETFTIFDSKQIHDNKPLFWDDQEVSGSGTTSVYAQDTASSTISVGTGAGKRVRQTRMRFNYQPGKSMMCIYTMVLGTGESGITQQVGSFNDDNGIFLSCEDAVVYFIMRTSVTGTPVDLMKVAQSNWNKDKLDGTGPSGVTLDFTKTQIFFFDFEWLGVGRVRYGFFHNGVPIYAHYMQHSNVLATVYMSTPNLPARYSIENDGTGGASSMVHMCTSIISEGGQDANGILRYSGTGGTHIDANAANTLYAVVGIRLKAAHLDGIIREVSMSVLAETNSAYEWVLLLNPTVADTFTYSDETNSIVQIATGATANTVTLGTALNGGWGQARTEVSNVLPSALYPGALIDGTPDEIVLCARPLSNNLDIQGSLTWRELS